MGTRHTFITEPLYVGVDDEKIKAIDKKIADRENLPREIFKQEIKWHENVQVVYYHGFDKNMGGSNVFVGIEFFDIVNATLSDEGDYNIWE